MIKDLKIVRVLTKQFKSQHIVLFFILFAIYIFRFPSLFEPYWYGDEGIFAAVGRSLNFGGVLYADAWDNKPPMIYLTYQAIFNIFGVSMFWLRLVTAIVVLATAAVVYEIALMALGIKRALLAAFIFGLLTSLRIVEGNLALTEIFMILPISAAFLIALLRKFDKNALFWSGLLFAIASLYKQVGALEAVAFAIYFFFWSIKSAGDIFKVKTYFHFFKKAWYLGVGFLVPFVFAFLYFAPQGLFDDYIFAAYTYYRIYLQESPQYAFLINVLKFSPILAAIWYGWRKKLKDKFDVFHLFLLWTAFSFLGSYFSGRTYGHYLVQAAPALSLLLASISFNFKFKKEQLVFGVVFFGSIIFLTKLLFTDFLSGGPLNQIGYYKNFTEFSRGAKNIGEYNSYFDSSVNSIMALRDFFAFNNVHGASAYIWGDYPWLYAIADFKNPSRYVTSFHVFGVPDGKEEVISDLSANPPQFIIKPERSIGYFGELEKLIVGRYTLVSKIENSEVFVRTR